METLEFIEAFFDEELSPERKKEFEQKIITEPMFAEEGALYLSAKQVAAAEMRKQKERFKEIYQQYKQDNNAGRQQPTLLRKLLPWAVAVAVLAGIIFSLNIWLKPVPPYMLADKYIQENFQTLPVKMDTKQDSLQTGLRLYNEGRMEEALKQFISLADNDTYFFEAKKYGGIVSLRLGQYDKAISYFSQIESNTQYFANPGKFYHALALLKRNSPGDKETANQLLQQVVKNNLQGRKEAEEWLEKW